MVEARQFPMFTVDEYLALEEENPYRHEYDRGVIYMMAGAKEDHRTIASNIGRRIANHVEGKGCFIWYSDTRVALPKDPAYFYPDVVACGERVYEKNRQGENLLIPSSLSRCIRPQPTNWIQTASAMCIGAWPPSWST